MLGIFRRKKKNVSGNDTSPKRFDYDVQPSGGPLLVDFGPRKVCFAGSLSSAWFVSHRYEPLLLALDAQGQVRDTFPCPPIDRVYPIDGSAWSHYMEALGGLEKVAFEESSSGALRFHLRRTNGPIFVPSLDVVSYEASTPPRIRYHWTDTTVEP